MKWARKTQRHLFPHLAPLGAKSAAKVADGNRKDLLTLQQAEIEPAEGAHCRAGRGERVLARAAGRGDDMRLLPKKELGRELVPLDDVVGNLPFIVRRGHRIVAAFAFKETAEEWAQMRSWSDESRFTVHTATEVFVFRDGEEVR